MQRLTFQVASLALATHGLTLGGAPEQASTTEYLEQYKELVGEDY